MTQKKKSSKKNNSIYDQAKKSIKELPRPKILSVVAHFDLPSSTRELVDEPHSAITKMLQHNNICTQFIKKYGGLPTKELGDAVLAEFSSFPQAVKCAKDAITYLKNSNCNICTKVSISLGRIEKIKTRKEPDIYGIPVNLCTRFAGIVDEDSILIEESRLGETIPFLDNTAIKLHRSGTTKFHGFPDPIQVIQITII